MVWMKQVKYGREITTIRSYGIKIFTRGGSFFEYHGGAFFDCHNDVYLV